MATDPGRPPLTRVIFDISPIHPDPAERTGVARVTAGLARRLPAAPGVTVRYSAVGSVRTAVGLARVAAEFPGGGLAVPPTRLAGAAVRWEQHLGRRPGGPAKAAGATVRAGLRAWNLVRRKVPAEALTWADLYHSSYARVPTEVRRRRLPVLVNLYDLLPLVLPADLFAPSQPAVTRRIIAGIAPTDWVLSNSHASLADFCRFTGRDPAHRCRVIPWAADPAVFHPVTDEGRLAAVRDRYRIPPGPYFLTLSSLAPHKNVALLVRAFCRAAADPAFREPNLVLAGGKELPSAAWLDRVIGDHPARRRIHLTGYVAESDLAALYAGAVAFAFPSLGEGFGLPVLEAMQCGTPVVVSDTSSLPEVVGTAGLLLPPADEDRWVRALLDLAGSDTCRQTLATAASARAATFTWERVVAETVQAYTDARAEAAGGTR